MNQIIKTTAKLMKSKEALIAEQIKETAETFGLSGEELKHLKRAYFFSSISNGLVPDAFKDDYRSIYIMSINADSMNCPLIEVLQGGYFVHGRWGWYTEFKIKRVLQLGIFKGMEYETGGKDEGVWVRAVGTRPDGEKVYGTTVSLKMAKEEGWTKNPKYRTMPAYMLKKRAASFLINEVAPHIFGQTAASVEERETVVPEPKPTLSLGEAVFEINDSQDIEIKYEDVEEEDTDEEKQRMEVFLRVENKILEKKKTGMVDAVIVNTIGFELDDIEKQPIAVLMQIMKDLG